MKPSTTVEITTALHYVFDFRRDRLVFEQVVEPAVPVETWAASLFRVERRDTALFLPPSNIRLLQRQG